MTGSHLFEMADKGWDPARELDIISNIHLYVKDPHEFARAYGSYTVVVSELCTGNPEPVSKFLARWPHKKAQLI